MRLIRRTEWGARAPRHRTAAKWSQPATLHWNGPTITVGGKTTWPHDRCAQLVRGIQNFHMDGRGWSDAAYNYVACPHRHIFELRGDSAVNGANGTNAGNRSSPTVMVLAGPGNAFSDDEKAGILDVRDHLVATTTTRPGLLGHRDHKPTDCPGDERYHWLRSNPTAAPTPTSEEDDMPTVLAALRPKAGSNDGHHIYVLQGRMASWCPDQDAIAAAHFLGATWWGGAPERAFLDPAVWQSMAVMNGPLANLRAKV